MNTQVTDFFDKTWQDKKEKIAVIEGDRKLSFENAAKLSGNLAKKLCYVLNEKRNKLIAVYLPKSIETVIADLGILYSCNMFMNLDIKTPEERICNILKYNLPSVIVTNDKLKESIKTVCDKLDTAPIILDINESVNKKNADIEVQLKKIRKEQIDTDPFCVINTSGSTGIPKGVVLNHKSFFDFMAWSIETFQFTGDEIMGSLSPCVFDIYVFELCLLMYKGATMVLLDQGLAMFPVKLLEIMREENVNFIFWVPSIMVNIANMDLLSKLPLTSMKRIWFAGEVFPTKQFNYWKRQLPSVQFTNLYGPIEITLDCTYFIVDREFSDNEPLPIGFPCRNTDILVLNEENEECVDGEEGELCVRGTSLAMGYYKNSEKTKASFVQNPLQTDYPEIIYRTGDIVYKNSHGEYMFKGRKDSLIKHMGYRIELGEIEHIIINQLGLVKYCCATYKKAEKLIVLFYESDHEIGASEFRKALMGVLPKYMLPACYIRKDELPRNTNGKIDRQKLNEEVSTESV